jgi:hypothetical protein
MMRGSAGLLATSRSDPSAGPGDRADGRGCPLVAPPLPLLGRIGRTGPSMITRRNLDALSGRPCHSWIRHLCMASSRRCFCLAVDRRIEAALEMVVMKNLARTRKRSQVRRRPQQRCTPTSLMKRQNSANIVSGLTQVSEGRILFSLGEQE